MSRGDIELPNQSGVIDPRIDREAALQRQRAFLAQEQQRASQPRKREALITVLKKGLTGEAFK